MKNANPSDLLPECTTVRGKLQKLELTQKSMKKILKQHKIGRKKKFTGCKSPPQKSPKKMFKSRKSPTKSRSGKYESDFGKRSMSVTHSEDLVQKFEQINSNLEKMSAKDQKIQKLEKEIEHLRLLSGSRSECICETLTNVDKFECSSCKWLVQKENFDTHLSFCNRDKPKTEDSISDELVHIQNEPEARIKDSISVEALQDICNIYNDKKSSLQDYSEMRSPPLSPFPTSLEGCKHLERTPVNMHNKENSRNVKDRYKTTDSFIQRLSQSQSILNFGKDEEVTEDITNFEVCKVKQSSQMRTSDTQAMTYRSNLDQEASHILDRVKRLKEDLETMRSPFRHRSSTQLT